VNVFESKKFCKIGHRFSIFVPPTFSAPMISKQLPDRKERTFKCTLHGRFRCLHCGFAVLHSMDCVFKIIDRENVLIKALSRNTFNLKENELPQVSIMLINQAG